MKKKEKSNKLLLLWYSHPRIAIALTLVLANLAIIAVFTGILSLISGNSFLEELSYIFAFTMSADGIYDFVNGQDDIYCFIIKVALALIQMVIFSGALIGFTTDVLQSTIDKRLRNTGRLVLKNHYAFLNWSSIGPNLIYDLSFLEGEKTIVILTETDADEVRTSIDNIFTENNVKMKGIRLYIKTGDPTSPKHLSDISICDAAHIGVLLTNQEDNGVHPIPTKDLTAFKLLMSLLHMGTMANIVVEVEKNETATKIEQFIREAHQSSDKRISIFSHNSVIGHILGRAVINPIYSYLFHELLSYDGCEFYGIPPMKIEQALYRYNDCIPIVNYDDDGAVDADGKRSVDQLYVLSTNEQSLGERREPRSFVRPMLYKENIEREEFTLFIISDSDVRNFVIDELDNYNDMHENCIRYTLFSFKDSIDTIIDAINATEGKKKVLLLSAEAENEVNQDADIFITLLAFRTSGRISKDIDIYTEIANPRNLVPMQNLGVVSVIVTNKIISLFMIQLLTHPESEKFYRDIIVANGDNSEDVIDLDVLKAKELLSFEGDSLEFGCASELVQSFYLASNKTRMCIGVKYASDPTDRLTFFCDAMDEPRKIVISPDDEFITIDYSSVIHPDLEGYAD